MAEEVNLLHRSFPAEDLTEIRGLPIADKALTVLSSLNTIEGSAGFLDRCLQQKTVTVAELNACLERNSGMHGLSRARELLAALEAGAESEAERLFIDLLRLHQITGFAQHVWFHGQRLDFAWASERVSVEINGWAYHRDRDRFEADNAKAAMLAAHGWLGLAFTWKQLTEDPEECIAKVAAALALRRA